jgi:hypothetical protein
VLIEQLEAEVPEKPKRPYGGFGTGSGGHGPLASWNSQAALLLLEIHAGIRELETDVKYQLSGRVRSRGGSDGNTFAALDGLAGLVATADYTTAQTIARKLENWAFRARLVLGEVEPFSRLPRLPGQKEPACPYCQSRTLRYRPFSGQVRCVRPGCKDGNGDSPVGKLDVGAYSGEPELAWADGTTGAAV